MPAELKAPPEAVSAAAPPAASAPPHWFLRPNVQIAISIVLSAAAQVLLKLGAEQSVHEDAWLGISGLRSGWVWLGILAMVTSLLSWLYALRFVPLNVAFNLAGAVQALVPLASWAFLGEHISPTRWLGIALVLAGVVVIAKPAGEAEDKL